MIIKELTTDAEFSALYDQIKALNAALTKSDYQARLKPMRAQGYRCVAAYDKESMVGAAGFWIGWRFWCGKYIDIDNVIVSESMRGRHVGKKMMSFVEAIGRAESCDLAVLDTYASNFSSHKFYYKQDYFILGYHMVKSLRVDGKLPDSAVQPRQ